MWYNKRGSTYTHEYTISFSYTQITQVGLISSQKFELELMQKYMN
jgi:hypothetical protein